MMDAVVAVYDDWGIGSNGTQPVSLKADRARFKALTMGKTVIVGRRTLQDFPGGKPLPGRRNLILTHRDEPIPGAELVHSLSECPEEDCIVIGGASVYKQLFPFIRRVYVTKLKIRPESDSFFPNLDEMDGWKRSSQSEWMTENGIDYCFCIYERSPDISPQA